MQLFSETLGDWRRFISIQVITNLLSNEPLIWNLRASLEIHQAVMNKIKAQPNSGALPRVEGTQYITVKADMKFMNHVLKTMQKFGPVV